MCMKMQLSDPARPREVVEILVPSLAPLQAVVGALWEREPWGSSLQQPTLIT